MGKNQRKPDCHKAWTNKRRTFRVHATILSRYEKNIWTLTQNNPVKMYHPFMNIQPEKLQIAQYTAFDIFTISWGQ